MAIETTILHSGRVIEVTPTLSTDSYVAGDQLGHLQHLYRAGHQNAEALILDSLTMIDKSAQSAALDVLFFKSFPVIVSSDNQPFQISDNELAAKCTGVVSIASTDYKSLGDNSIATIRAIGLVLRAEKDSIIYALAIARAGVTFYGSTDLTFKYGMK